MRGRWGAAWAAQLQKLRHGHAHEDSRTPLVPSKGACWAGRDSKPLHLHHRWNRERWRTESADFCQTSFKSSRTFVVTHSRPSVSVTFWGTICASRFSDLTCGSGEKRQSAREPERRARRRLACTRGREPISRRRLCVSERWIQRRAGLSGGSSAAETGSSSEINCSPLSWTEAQVSFFFFWKSQESSGSPSDSPLHACLKWTEEGWMPAGLRVLETQVTAVGFLFHFLCFMPLRQIITV